MKANEFVKKHGWDEAAKLIGNFPEWADGYCEVDKEFLNYSDAQDGYTLADCEHCVEFINLKRLVESHELVAIHGFEKSKEIVANAPSDDHFYSWILGGSGVRDKTVNIGELRKAIADVESCMEVFSESN